ncbi:NRDE family protein [Cerasicoccus frondis]|uniref:NRDE family protein n=1 Tax=Cerasicoccus frondis TaxID=490090 RepID=UPI0028529EC7|nr:NRDE family protein [Cerasicoccus frondis]
MCTATWWSGANGYELFFNRDELKTRDLGLPPTQQLVNGVRFLAPKDPTGGGTWLLVNEFGVGICLINQYPDNPRSPAPQRISRGQLVLNLADCPDADAVRQRISTTALSCYEAFLLIAVDPVRPAQTFTWDTRTMSMQTVTQAQPFTSSSHLPDEVLRSRRRRFGDLVRLRGGDPTPDDLRAFHEHYAPATAAHSVFMSRSDASTVSLTHVVVGQDTITLEYAPRIPGAFQFDRARRLQLPRRQACVA